MQLNNDQRLHRSVHRICCSRRVQVKTSHLWLKWMPSPCWRNPPLGGSKGSGWIWPASLENTCSWRKPSTATPRWAKGREITAGRHDRRLTSGDPPQALLFKGHVISVFEYLNGALIQWQICCWGEKRAEAKERSLVASRRSLCFGCRSTHSRCRSSKPRPTLPELIDVKF